MLLAHNAEPYLEEVVASWVAYLGGHGREREVVLGREFEIILVDDGSTDRTAALAEGVVRRVLRHETRRGLGAALRTGLAAARHPLVACCPCDRQFQPQDLDRLLAEIDKVHVASGFRWARPMPLGLWLLGWVYRILVRITFADWPEPLPGWLGWGEHAYRLQARVLFGLRIRDVNCPFRLFRREIFERIPIQSDGDFANVEVLAKANFLGCLMTEEPITHRPPPTPTKEQIQAGRRQRRRDLGLVFGHPNFGPPVLSRESQPGLQTPLAGAAG